MSERTSDHELRFTETNSADDSAGKTWGLEGNLFWFVAGGAFAAVLTLLLLFSVWRWSLLSAAVPAPIPLVLSMFYALALRQGKPPGYDIDLFELWLKGSWLRTSTVARSRSVKFCFLRPCLSLLPTAITSATSSSSMGSAKAAMSRKVSSSSRRT